MRLSTQTLHELSLSGLHRQQSDAVRLQEQISTGRRINKPSDDPVSSAAAINLDQSRALNKQYGENAATARAALNLLEQAYGDATRVLQDVKTLTIQAGNAALQDSDRASIAKSVEGLYGELLGIANRTDENGAYLFSGYQGGTKPFVQSAPGAVAYQGDEGQRLMRIGPERRIAIGESGVEVFQRVREGNGTFVSRPGTSNAGTAVVGAGAMRDAQAWANPANSRDYTIAFHVDSASPPVTTYDVVDNVAGVSMLTGLPPAAGPHARTYTVGTPIALQRQAGDPSAAAWNAGVDIDVSGAPASGDTVSVARAQNVDVFAMLNDLKDTLQGGIAGTPAARAAYQNALNASNANFDRALDQILTARASAGTRLQEVDGVSSSSADLDVHYETELSRLRDLDYAQALSDLARKQIGLEAAQKSYVAVSRLSLFQYL